MKNVIDDFDLILQEVKLLSSKQLYLLPHKINELSHLLTDERSSRRSGYMNDNVMLSAYSHYFLWWNLYRLTKLFSQFDQNAFDFLSDGDYCLDLGSGSLTVVTALWIARPELRRKKLGWYCVDLSQNALSLGEEIYLNVCSKTMDASDNSVEPWRIIRVKGEFGTKLNNPVKFITVANMFNELYYDTRMPLEEAAKKNVLQLLKYFPAMKSPELKNRAALIVEPAFPRSSRFVSLTRDCLLRNGFDVVSPCPHCSECPMDGRKGGKWCHFVFETKDAPEKLHKLSEKSNLPKDRACMSFVFAVKKSGTQCNAVLKKDGDVLLLRIASDEIFLPGQRTGRYACSKLGLVLFVGKPAQKAKSGDLICVDLKKNKIDVKKLLRDKKSGALIIEL